MPVATAGSKTIFSHFTLSHGERVIARACFPSLRVVEEIARGCFPLYPWSTGSYGAFPPSACGGENRAGLFLSMPVVDGIVRAFFPLCLWSRESLGAVSLYARGRWDRTGLFPSMPERAGVRASDPTTRRRSPSDGVPPKFNNL